MFNSQRFAINFIFCVIAIYVWAVLRYAVNMPFGDDYDAILNFLNNFHVSNLSEKIKFIFSQHNEHRIVFNRVVEICQLEVFGEVNFVYLILVGNIGWGCTIYLLWVYCKNNSISLAYFVPIVLLMLSFAHWELMTWAMASLQQYWQVFFSLLAIWMLTQSRLFIAIFFMYCSIFTGGGGIVLIGVFLLYAITNRNWRVFFYILIFSLIVLFIYFVLFEYLKPVNHPSILQVLHNPHIILAYSLTFIGSFGGSQKISMVIGVFEVLLFTRYARQTYQKNSFLFWSILFVLCTAILTGLARAGFGIEQAVSSRYSEYSLLLVSLIYLQYLFIFKDIQRFIIQWIGFLLSLVVFFSWLTVGIEKLQNHKEEINFDSVRNPSKEWAESILLTSAKNHFFTIWKGIYLPSEILTLEPLEDTKNDYCISIANTIDVCNNRITKYHSSEIADSTINIPKNMTNLHIEGWTVDSQKQDRAYGAYVKINEYKKILNLLAAGDVAKHFNNKKYEISRFDESIDISTISEDKLILTLRTINHAAEGYYESIKITIIKGNNNHELN